MGYTLKQAAEILGMTKPGIRYRITMLEIPLNKDAFGRISLSDDDLQWIREGKKPESIEKQEKEPERKPESIEKEPEEIGKNQKEPEGNAEAVALAVLREQIAVKDAQIASLTAQLENVTEALRAAQRSLEGAQALHAATVKQLQEATADEPEPVDEDPGEPEQRKKGLFWWINRSK